MTDTGTTNVDRGILLALRHLDGATTGGTPGLTAWAIATHIGTNTNTVRRRLHRLYEHGDVTTTANPLDRRTRLYRTAR